MYYDYYKQEYFTKNRKLKLEEYDNDGNLIDVREFADDDLAMLIMDKLNQSKPLKVARKKHLDEFTTEELELIDKFIIYSNSWSDYGEGRSIGYITDDDIELFKGLLKIQKEKLEFILKISHPDCTSFNYGLQSENVKSRKKMTFNQAIELVNSRDGIYYSVDNNGNNISYFLDIPTLKQVKYQRNKGRRIVYLNFLDWKKYIVNESEFK